jgi:hypothetical protein
MARAVFLLLDFYLRWHLDAIIDKIVVSGKFEYGRRTS